MEIFCRFNKLPVICVIDAIDKTNKLSVSNKQSSILFT